MTFIIKIKD